MWGLVWPDGALCGLVWPDVVWEEGIPTGAKRSNTAFAHDPLANSFVLPFTSAVDSEHLRWPRKGPFQIEEQET